MNVYMTLHDIEWEPNDENGLPDTWECMIQISLERDPSARKLLEYLRKQSISETEYDFGLRIYSVRKCEITFVV